MTTTDKPVQLFLSYTRKDKVAVTQFYERLAAVGLKPWMDQEDILPGELWQESILHAIRDSHFFLACISPNSVEKRGVLQRELREALDAWKDKLPGDIYLIPVRLEECAVPDQLNQFQWVDIFHTEGWRRLLRAIQRGTGRLGLQTPNSVLSELASTPASSKTPAFPDLLTIDKPVHLELMRVPAGPFLMGDDAHPADLPEFHIGKYPITNQQYAAFVEVTRVQTPNHWIGGAIPTGKENHPVTHVQHKEAVTYCQWLYRITAQPFRLPTLAEWEKAARGADGRIYPWGNEPAPNPDLCNFKDGGIGDTTPVDCYRLGASPYGCLDMTGNAWEWTADKTNDGWAWLKGGSYWRDADWLPVFVVGGGSPNFPVDYLGFRVAVDPFPRTKFWFQIP